MMIALLTLVPLWVALLEAQRAREWGRPYREIQEARQRAYTNAWLGWFIDGVHPNHYKVSPWVGRRRQLLVPQSVMDAIERFGVDMGDIEVRVPDPVRMSRGPQFDRIWLDEPVHYPEGEA